MKMGLASLVDRRNQQAPRPLGVKYLDPLVVPVPGCYFDRDFIPLERSRTLVHSTEPGLSVSKDKCNSCVLLSFPILAGCLKHA